MGWHKNPFQIRCRASQRLRAVVGRQRAFSASTTNHRKKNSKIKKRLQNPLIFSPFFLFEGLYLWELLTSEANFFVEVTWQWWLLATKILWAELNTVERYEKNALSVRVFVSPHGTYQQRIRRSLVKVTKKKKTAASFFRRLRLIEGEGRN